MSCREFSEFLDRYVEGELGDVERLEFERHLAACPACVAYLESYRRTTRLARALGASDALPGVPDELVAAVLASRRNA